MLEKQTNFFFSTLEPENLEWRTASESGSKIFLFPPHCHNFHSSCFILGSNDKRCCGGRGIQQTYTFAQKYVAIFSNSFQLFSFLYLKKKKKKKKKRKVNENLALRALPSYLLVLQKEIWWRRRGPWGGRGHFDLQCWPRGPLSGHSRLQGPGQGSLRKRKQQMIMHLNRV